MHLWHKIGSVGASTITRVKLRSTLHELEYIEMEGKQLAEEIERACWALCAFVLGCVVVEALMFK